jgi:hypothetical protein
VTTLRAIIAGGVTVGVLDLTDAFIFFGLRDVPVIRIPQSIAAGAIGRTAAFTGGAGVAALGVALHFALATMIVAVYVFACRVIPALAKRPLVFGPAYGLVVYAVMNLVVIPLSAAPAAALPSGAALVNGLLIHMLGVGLPSALFARAIGS